VGLWRRRWRTWGLGLTLGLLAAVVALGAVASSRARLEAPEPTLMLLDRHDRFLGEVGEGADERLGYWPVDPLPERVVAATMAIEDRRFREHPGVDLRAVARALHQNHSAGERVSGASTLAMQLARIQDPGPRTWPRKAVEAATALVLTHRFGRDAVLAHYLRIAPYGNNVYGIGYAARRYFDKPVQDLSWAETALLCALPQAPGRMNPYRDEGRALATARARRILELLHEQGLVSDGDLERAHDELDVLVFHHRRERPQATLHPVLHLEAHLADPEVHATLSDDPIVRTTLDLEVQASVQARLREAVRGWEARGAGNAAAVVVDLHGYEVVAAVGSTDWFDPRYAGAIDYTRVPRYPGSTLKPFLYGASLDRGLITPATVLDDIGRGPEGIGNADARFLGPLLPRRALANSRNVPAVELAQRYGLDETYALYRDLGLHDDALPASHYGLGLTIGGMPVHLVDLVRAYTVLAGDGQLHPLAYYERQPRAPERRVLTADTARAITLYLSDPMARLPSFPRMGYAEYPFPAAVKTGTSPDFRDAWAVAWSGRYLVGVWVGHPDWRPMQQLSGYRAGARLTQQILLSLHEGQSDGLSDLAFPSPEQWAPLRLCALSGHRATRACEHVITEWFPPGAAPVHDCDWHVRLGRRTVVDLPPRYASWAQGAGLTQLRTRAPPTPGREDEVHLAIVTPHDGTHLIRDPEAPPGLGTLRLQAAVDPPVEQVVWYVDGEPFAVVDHPYVARWPLRPGEHVFEVRVPFSDAASNDVRVLAR
jgi:penicillin-binding protein 1C